MATSETTIKTTGGKKTISKFSLPNKKVTLLPIVREKMFMGVKNHDGMFMYTGAFQVWCIFKNQYGDFGSGNPNDKKTEQFIIEKLKNEEYCPIIRYNWKTIERLKGEMNESI